MRARNFKDETGNQYGRLTVLEFAGVIKGKSTWKCKCACGNECIVTANKLRMGSTKSCGCLQREHRKNGDINRTHGMSKTHLYVLWMHMKARCDSPSQPMYYCYGGRGIRYCDEWKVFEPFKEWAIANGYKEGLSLERINVNGNYEPSNCKWILPHEQHWNLQRSHRITAFGKTQTIAEWALETGLKYDTIERRINQYGWTVEDALTVLPHKKRK